MTSPAVPTTDATDPADPAAAAVDAGPMCPVCPHPVAAHDRISARYCAASADQVARGVLTNPGCSCP